MATRVTIQDIADALGLSRNTVSKAINNTGVLADSTREKVLMKAMEMGYKQFSYVTISEPGKSGLSLAAPKTKNEIALFSTVFLDNSHFSSTLLDKFQREMAQLGYSLTIHRILPEELSSLSFPASFFEERTAGIVCVEVFDMPYAQMLCEQNIPLLFIDSPSADGQQNLNADKLYMDNSSNTYLFCREMAKRGKSRIGFIGESLHCQSFFDRYMAYRNALYLLGLPCPDAYCITKNKEGVRYPSSEEYKEYLFSQLSQLKTMPDVWICANDFVALDVKEVLKTLGYSVPQDVYLCGFDDSPESRITSPTLTTIHIHSQIMGYSAVQLLISRINEPSLNFRTLHTETSLVYRESTGD